MLSRLVLEGEACKKTSEPSWLEFLEKFLANNFALSDVEDNTTRAINTGGIADLFLLRTREPDHQEKSRVKFLGKDILFCFISMSEFSSFKNPFVTIIRLPELHFRCRRFILLVQTK